MKILAIRLKNLASLAGEHVLDFTTEPLQSAGLLAITGPTGAGKSTLLDALCLALFGTTPRLEQAGSATRVPDGSEEQLTGRDERNLLRRGTAEGWAEVDFLGVDGRRYRARWAVRRARNKTTGKLQNSEQSLYDLEEQRLLTSGKREFAAELEARLGLNREQFVRAVLLAQSEFSAFLRADDNARGELLERLTDTGLYSRLGIAAFQAEKQAREAVEQLQREAGSQCPLDGEARRALDSELEQARAALAGARAQQQLLLRLQDWQQQEQQLAQQLAAASSELARQQALVQDSAPERQRLQQLQRLAPQRHRFQRQHQLAGELDRLSQQIGDIFQQQDVLQQQLEQLGSQHSAAQQASEAAEQARQLAAPALRSAAGLEHQLGELAGQIAQLQAADPQLALQLADAQQRQQLRREAQQRRQQEQQQLQARLEAGSALHRLAQHWSAHQPQLAQAVRLQQRIRQGKAELPAILQRADSQSAALSAVDAQLTELLAAGSPLQQLDQVQQQLSASHQQQASLGELHTRLQRQQELAERQQQRQARRQALQARQHAIAEQLPQCLQQLQLAELQQEACEQLIARQQLARSQHVEALRADLVDGEPCPVCGSAQHPWQQHELLSAFAAIDQQALQQARQAVLDLREQRSGLLGEQQRIAGELPALDGELQAISAEIQQLDAQIATQAELATLPPAQRLEWVSQQRCALSSQLEQLQTRQQQLTASQQQIDRLQRQRGQLQHQASEAVAQLTQQQQALQQDQEQLQRLDQQLLPLLPPAFHAHWQQDPGQLLLQLEPQVQQLCADSEALQELEQELQADREALVTLAATVQQAQAELQHSRDASAGLIARQQTQQQALQALLGEQAGSAQWQQQLDQQCAQHRSALEQAISAQQAAARQQAALQARLQELLEQQGRLEQEAASLQAGLDQWRSQQQDLDGAQLQALLQVDDASVGQLASQLAALDQALQAAAVRSEERQQQLTRHRQQQPAGPLGDELAAQLAASSSQLAALEQRSGELLGRQSEDERRRQLNQALLARIEAAQAERVRWGRLAELIGSADGKRFRVLAQGYNLDLLLAHANQQLRNLARRYRLERGGSELGILVIDTEMGDERRSVHSLSGGESFLISLALALGLADMASGRLRIESLFIDEGFGSLDPDSLQLALDALDSLQAQGRKVALISHVQELHERIPVQIRVQRLGSGASGIEVVG